MALTQFAQSFLVHATGAIEALRETRRSLQDAIDALLRYFGEDPTKSKPEDLFSLMATFSASLLVRLDTSFLVMTANLLVRSARKPR